MYTKITKLISHNDIVTTHTCNTPKVDGKVIYMWGGRAGGTVCCFPIVNTGPTVHTYVRKSYHTKLSEGSTVHNTAHARKHQSYALTTVHV